MDSSALTQRIGPPRPGIAERIWDAARTEFSQRGYHGARVQGIARGASCNVALMYRHWASKRALYLDILRAVWLASTNEIARIVEDARVGPDAVVAAYVDAMMADSTGAQILIREYLDGATFLSQLSTSDPSILEPLRRVAFSLSRDGASALPPVLSVVTVGGVAAFVAAMREAARPFVPEPIEPEVWRHHVLDLLVHGLSPGGDRAGEPRADWKGSAPPRNGSAPHT